MFFSEYFEIDPRLLLEYGALDISLVCDLPLFIDPMLIFNSNKPEYKKLHEGIIKYFYFLAQKAQNKLQKNLKNYTQKLLNNQVSEHMKILYL